MEHDRFMFCTHLCFTLMTLHGACTHASSIVGRHCFLTACSCPHRRTAAQALYLIDKGRPHYKDNHDNIDFEAVTASFNNGLLGRAPSQPKIGPRDRESLKDQMALMRKACRAVSEHGTATGGGSQYFVMTDAAKKEYLVSCGGLDLGTASSWYDSSVHTEFRNLVGDKVYKVQEMSFSYCI